MESDEYKVAYVLPNETGVEWAVYPTKAKMEAHVEFRLKWTELSHVYIYENDTYYRFIAPAIDKPPYFKCEETQQKNPVLMVHEWKTSGLPQ